MALSAADKIEIIELIARYSHALDSGDGDAWADTFTEDGVLESPYAQPHGRAAIRQRMADMDPARRKLRHWVNGVVIEGDGDTATLTCYLNVLDTTNLERSAETGIYHDTLSRVDGARKFSRRKVTLDA